MDDVDSSDIADSVEGANSISQQTPPEEKPSGQASSSDSGEQSGAGSGKPKNKKKRQKPASSQPSASDFPQDIEWSPEDETSGLVPFIQATAARTRDSSEDKTTVVCEALYAADPEGVARGVKIMTGCEPDDDQTVLAEFIHLARVVGMDEYLTGEEAWYTTRLGPPEELGASATDYQPKPNQAQVHAEADGFEQPEINLPTQYYLSETYPEWDSSRTEKEDLESFLKGKLKAHIQEFDEDSINSSR